MSFEQLVDPEPVVEGVDDREAAQQAGLQFEVGDIHRRILPDKVGLVAHRACNIYVASVWTEQPQREKVMSAEIPAETHAEQRRIVAEFGEIGFTLPGTISVRTVTCGRATCRCATDPDQRHGPYIQWSRTIKGRTRNKMLTPEQLETYQPWIDNGRRLRDLAHQLETLSLEAMRTAEGWKR